MMMRKEAEARLKIPAEDLQSAEILSDRKLFRPACYHAQQAVEKSLKALLIDRTIEIPRTHNHLDLNNAANLIHAFRKKTQTTPRRELDIIQKRLKEI